MDQVQAIYEKMKMKHPEINLIYDGPKGLLWYTNDDCSLEITKVQRGFNARFWYNGRCYDTLLNSEDEVCRVIELLRKKKIRVEEDPQREKHAKLINVLEPRKNKKNAVRYTIPTLIGIALIIFCLVILYGGYESVQSHHGVWEITDVGLVIFFLSGIYAGISLIRYAFGRFVGCVTNFFGILITGFGITEIFFSFSDVPTGKTTIGSAIGITVVFLLVIGCGVLLIWTSHQKRAGADLIVKRNPILPPPYTQAIRPEDRYVIRPLLMLDSRDERTFDTLLMNEGDFAHTSLQVFTSTYNLQHLADAFPEDVVTVHGFEVDSEYGKWDFK